MDNYRTNLKKMDQIVTTKTTSPDMALGGVHTTVMLSLSSEELWVIALAVPCENDFIDPHSLGHFIFFGNSDKPDRQQDQHM